MRRFRRPGRAMKRRFARAFRRGVLRGGPATRLNRAHQHMANREFSQAAAEYLTAANAAQARGLPQAARLFVAAGVATVMVGETDGGLELIFRGLGDLEQRGATLRFKRLAHRVIDELRSEGHQSAADQIENYMLERGVDQQEGSENQAELRALPTKCPYCGGSVHPDELEWVDARSAECDYCGSILRAEA